MVFGNSGSDHQHVLRRESGQCRSTGDSERGSPGRWNGGPGRKEFELRSGRPERPFGPAHPLDCPPEGGRVDGRESVKKRLDLFEMLHEPVPIDRAAVDHLLHIGFILGVPALDLRQGLGVEIILERQPLSTAVAPPVKYRRISLFAARPTASMNARMRCASANRRIRRPARNSPGAGSGRCTVNGRNRRGPGRGARRGGAPRGRRGVKGSEAPRGGDGGRRPQPAGRRETNPRPRPGRHHKCLRPACGLA